MSSRLRKSAHTSAIVSPTPPPGSVTAYQADTVADFMGVGSTGSNVTPTTIVDAFNILGLRHARLGLVSVGAGVQRNNANALATIGVDVMVICDDRGAQTPLSRMQEVESWDANCAGIEGPNEPQRYIAQVSGWQLTIATNGPTSSDTNLGIRETKRQGILIWDTRNSYAPMASVPVLMSALALKSKTGWYAKMVSDGDWSVTHGNIHNYMGGQDMLKGGSMVAYINETENAGFVDNPVIITECGYHDNMTTNDTHKPTLPAAQLVYFPRGLMQLWALGQTGGQLQRAYVHELIDDPNEGTPGNHEQHMGFFYMDGPTLTPKPTALALARLVTLYNDPGAPFSPTSLSVDVSSYANLKWWVHQKRDGTHLVSLWREESIYNTSTYEMISVPDVNITVTLPAGRTVTRHRVSPNTVVGMGSGGTYTVPVGADLTVLKVV